MDFYELNNFPKKNTEQNKKPENVPLKKNKKEKQLSENIKKFLKKREQEEKDALHLNNKKATESGITDREAGEEEAPEDQDDYGFVSNEANTFYEKYIKKMEYVKINKEFTPSRPKSLHDFKSTKEQLKQGTAKTAIKEETITNKRPRANRISHKAAPIKTISADKYNDKSCATKTLHNTYNKKHIGKTEKPKFKQAPINFHELMRIAEIKQYEEVEFPVQEKKEERPLSAQEKLDMAERQQFEKDRSKRERRRERQYIKENKERELLQQQLTKSKQTAASTIDKESTAINMMNKSQLVLSNHGSMEEIKASVLPAELMTRQKLQVKNAVGTTIKSTKKFYETIKEPSKTVNDQQKDYQSAKRRKQENIS